MSVELAKCHTAESPVTADKAVWCTSQIGRHADLTDIGSILTDAEDIESISIYISPISYAIWYVHEVQHGTNPVGMQTSLTGLEGAFGTYIIDCYKNVVKVSSRYGN